MMDDFYTVATTGGRDMHNVSMVRTALDELAEWLDIHNTGTVLVLAQGECPTGADELVRDWARDHGVPCIGIPAAWEALGRAAGPIRNGWLLDIVKPGVLYVFPGGRGTESMVKHAKARGIRRHVVK